MSKKSDYITLVYLGRRPFKLVAQYTFRVLRSLFPNMNLNTENTINTQIGGLNFSTIV